MFETIRKFFRGTGQEDVGTSPDEDASFVLELEGLEVGALRLHKDKWEFRYSESFQKQAREIGAVLPLIDFPEPTKVYESGELWPFFLARIPSVSQPQVLDEIARRGVDPTSAAQLLKLFGKRSIANPFLLTPA